MNIFVSEYTTEKVIEAWKFREEKSDVVKHPLYKRGRRGLEEHKNSKITGAFPGVTQNIVG